MHIQGEMQVGEAARYAGRASARLSGHPKPIIIANLAAALTTVVPILVFGAWQSAVDGPAWLWLPALPLAMAFGFWAGPAACRRYTVGTFRRNLAMRGLNEKFLSSITVTDDAFISSTGRMTVTAPWTAVSDLVHTDRYWIFLVEGHPQFLPRRFFTSPVEEKAFLQAILNRVSPEARNRSNKAVAFAAS
ncbi:YcxB family protein [Brevundimonas sp.]|uniref:YcxB family protein n=1 Tax=Brevundimonas sp. TaxID=1871086 RepID=UPI002737C2FD|nr:YcxB family protein [Brevundimonas sp.]MDP3802477.1 YcxB family protein [Brevundimonas sp.]